VVHGKILVCAFVLLLGPGLSEAAPQDPPAIQPPVQNRPEAKSDATLRTTYQLGPDDQIMILVTDIPDISGKPQRLDPDGDLRLPMVGRVRAAGMTLEQLEAELTKRLKVFIQEPDVAVTVTEFHSQPVSVIGAVNTSGVHQLEGSKTLIEMLSLAGGVSADAGPTVRITRRLEWGRISLPGATEDPTGGFSIAEIDLKSLLEARTPETNIIIRAHDVISVPRAELIYIVGEVAKPGPLPLSGGTSMSLIEAVSASGGVLRSAAASHARILRRIPGEQKRTELGVNLRQIMQGKANDQPLLAGDILIVPDSRGKRATARALEAALQAGLLIGTYGIVR
jgi:polysaccharide export outer membrane protein